MGVRGEEDGGRNYEQKYGSEQAVEEEDQFAKSRSSKAGWLYSISSLLATPPKTPESKPRRNK